MALRMPMRPADVRNTATCRMSVWLPASRLIASTVEGHLDEVTARELSAHIPLLALDGPGMLGFHDWRGVTDYDGGARNLLTEIMLRHMRSIERAHFLASSKIVRFGIGAAAAVLGKVTLHDTPDTFEAALLVALRTREARAAAESWRPPRREA